MRNSLKIKGKNLKLTTLGFTLIELLAVIVILAIIALIAVPIILNIINDSKKSSDMRSIELYGKAVENAIGQYQVKNPHDTDITLAKVQEYIKYKGNKVECTTTKINKDGTIYLEGCKVSNKNVEYTYGTDKTSTDVPTTPGGPTTPGEPGIPDVPEPVSFESDDWSTIVANVKAGNTSEYNIGDAKEVNLRELGTHTLRIANNSTPDECNTEGFSQTACGFVLEFEDVITMHNMNSNNTNIGGWKDSEMRAYVNETIYNSLPTEIKDSIIDTYVISGHEKNASTNYITTDKLYLLSTKEVWGTTDSADTLDATRQLDYYKDYGVTTSDKFGAIKICNGSEFEWWLRSADLAGTRIFYYVNIEGDVDGSNANYTTGISPAFRIG